jgi:hypothetical protein
VPEQLNKEYAQEVLRLSRKNFKQPTLKQIEAMERLSGLNAYVKKSNPLEEIQKAKDIYSKKFTGSDIPDPVYPNYEKVRINGGGVRNEGHYSNQQDLYYNSASSIDSRLKTGETKFIKGKPYDKIASDIKNSSKKMALGYLAQMNINSKNSK